MDWLGLELCAIIWVLFVSKSHSQTLQNKELICTEGEYIPPPDECNKCICFEGQIRCTHLLCSSKNNTMTAQECVNDEDIPQPDECNQCICHGGQIACSDLICIPAPECISGKLYPPPNDCNICMCQRGFIACTYNNCEVEKRIENTEPECVSGQLIPKPDDCNNCICFEGQIHCTHVPCEPLSPIGPECYEGQPVYRPDECNECYCVTGKLECSDLVCIRGSKCTTGQVIAKPDSCNSCTCVEGHILCTNHQCPKTVSQHAIISETTTEAMEVLPLNYECQDDDFIPPPPPPDDCNKCICLQKTVLCTQKNCLDEIPDINGRFKEQNEQKDLDKYDKKIAVEPFIDMLYKNYNKTPTKLIHTHTFNGFHQEIKVHSKQLPKDTTKLLKALASSLDNRFLAGIGDKHSSSPDFLLNNDRPNPSVVFHVEQKQIPPVHESEGNMLPKHSLGSFENNLSHSSKLITSGLQSNETILVIPNIKSHEIQMTHPPVLITDQHETYWNTITSPAPLILKRDPQNSPLVISSTDQHNITRNPKLGRPGYHNMYPTGPSRNTEDKTYTPFTKQILPINPKPTNNNMKPHAPFSQEDKQHKPIPPNIISVQDEFGPIHPQRPTKPVNQYTSNVTTISPLIFNSGQEQHFNNSSSKDSKQDPSKFRFEPNLKHYHSQFKPPRIIDLNLDKDRQRNNKSDSYYSLLLQLNPNRTTIAPNHYNSFESRFRPDPEKIATLGNKPNQPSQQFKSYPINNNNQFHPSQTSSQPNQEIRLFNSENKDIKQKPLHNTFEPNPPGHHTDQFFPPQNTFQQGQHKPDPTIAHSSFVTHDNPPHSHLKADPTTYYTYKYKLPEITLKPGQEQPFSTISYTHTEGYNPSQTVFESDQEKHNNVPLHNEGGRYNTTHTHYETHSTIAYVSEYDPLQNEVLSEQNIPVESKWKPDLHTYASHNKTMLINPDNRYGIPEQQDNDVIRYKVKHYLTTHSNQNRFNPYQLPRDTLQIQSKISENDQSNPHGSWDTRYDPSPQNNQPLSKWESAQHNNAPYSKPTFINPDDPYVLFTPDQIYEDVLGYKVKHYLTTNSNRNTFNPNQEPRNNIQIQSIISEDNQYSSPGHLSNLHDLKSNPKRNISTSTLNSIFKHYPHSSFQSQFELNPGIHGDRGPANRFQYVSNSAEDPKISKLNQFEPPRSLIKPFQNRPRALDVQGPADGSHYISHYSKDLIIPKMKQFKPSHSQFKIPQDQIKPETFDDRGPTHELQYISAKDSSITKIYQNEQSHSHLNFLQNRPNPEVFGDRASTDRFQYVSNYAGNPTVSKAYHFNVPQSLFKLSENQPNLGTFEERGPTDGFQYILNSAETKTPASNQYKPTQSPLYLLQSQIKPKVVDESGSADRFQYILKSVEDPTIPKVAQLKQPLSQFEVPQNKQKSGIFEDHESAGAFYLHKPNFSPFELPQDQLNTGDFDNSGSADLFKYMFGSGENLTTPNITSYLLLQSRFDVPQDWSIEDREDPNGFHYNSSVKVTSIHQNEKFRFDQSLFKPKQNKPEQIPNWSTQSPDKNLSLSLIENYLQPDQVKSTPATELLESDSNKNNPVHYQLKPDRDHYISYGDSKDPYYGDQYDLANIMSAKKSKPPPIDDPKYAVGATDMDVDKLPFLLPKIFKNQHSPDEGKLHPSNIPKIKHLKVDYNSMSQWLTSNDSHLTIPTLSNGTATVEPPSDKLSKPDTDESFIKTSELISKFKLPLQTNLQTTTHYPYTELTMNTIQNKLKFMSMPTISEDGQHQQSPVRYPDVHIHNPGDDYNIPKYIENHAISQVPDINSEKIGEDIVGSFLPRMLHPRFRYRPKDLKEECGDGTEWISNCHGCSCYGGQSICFQIPDCHLRPFGEPMLCKPYSHFKMGDCYSCECNGDGVAECDATDCGKTELKVEHKQVKGSNEQALPVLQEFFDDKKTYELLQYYRVFKKLPKDCTSETLHPTCEVGTNWTSSCQKCVCNVKGQHECTLIEDCKLDYDKYGTPGRCKPNSKFYPKTTNMPCVECSCDDEGNPYCPTIDQKRH